jgi:hypothetical protein
MYSIPLNVKPDPDIDRSCEKIAKFLKERLNEEYPQISGNPVVEVVRSTVCYPAFNIDLTAFPLLKVYRTSDTYRKGTTQRYVRGVIEYCLTLPEVATFPGRLSWMSHHLNKLLLDSEQRFGVRSEEGGRTVDYRMTMNELGQPVYTFLRMSFSFTD